MLPFNEKANIIIHDIINKKVENLVKLFSLEYFFR